MYYYTMSDKEEIISKYLPVEEEMLNSGGGCLELEYERWEYSM